ncbi:hypothetical protein, partial [Lachnobacterium bovis]|uniref:hypothetical protein n=1 Tax=Lachnobacterium bovis TaxID=140626 RepID=UPI00047F53D2
MKTAFKKIKKENVGLICITCILSIMTGVFYVNKDRAFAYFEYKDKIRNTEAKNHQFLSCDFKKLKVLKTRNNDYVIIAGGRNENSWFELVSKNEIGSYAYETQGVYFTGYTESLESQRNRNIKKFEYDVYNLDKEKITKKLDLKAMLNKYCKNYWWTSYDIRSNEVVYSADGKTYITAGCVNPINEYYYSTKKSANNNILFLKSYDHKYRGIEFNYDYNNIGTEVIYGGLYISLDQKDIVKSLLYTGENYRNIFKSVGESNSKLDSRDIKYNFILNRIKNKYDMKEYYGVADNNDIINKIKTTNDIDVGFATDYTNPFCKVKIEFNSSDLKSNMTNLFN